MKRKNRVKQRKILVSSTRCPRQLVLVPNIPHEKMHRTFKSTFLTHLDEKGKICKTTYFMHFNSNKYFPKGPVHVFLCVIFGTSSNWRGHPVGIFRKNTSLSQSLFLKILGFFNSKRQGTTTSIKRPTFNIFLGVWAIGEKN